MGIKGIGVWGLWQFCYSCHTYVSLHWQQVSSNWLFGVCFFSIVRPQMTSDSHLSYLSRVMSLLLPLWNITLLCLAGEAWGVCMYIRTYVGTYGYIAKHMYTYLYLLVNFFWKSSAGLRITTYICMYVFRYVVWILEGTKHWVGT